MPDTDVVMRQMVAGGGAGAISRTLTAPMERVKVLLQVQIVSTVPLDKQYKGIIDCLIRIPQQQGILGYWRGNGINVVRMIPNSAIKFTTYDYYKSLAFPDGEAAYEGTEKYMRKMTCGALSGVSTITPVYPLDLARTRLSADSTSRYKGVGHLLKTTFEMEGIRGLYKGLGVSLCGIMPYLAISLSTYDTLKDYTQGVLFWQHPLGKVFLGSFAAIVSQSIVYPLDTVRRHMQVSGGLGQKKIYDGTMDCIMKLYSKYGIKGFYRGVIANATRAAPQTGIEFACFDVIAGLLSEHAKAARDMETFRPDKDSMKVQPQEDVLEGILVRRLSSSLPQDELARVNRMFAALVKESGFEDYEVDAVLVERLDFIDFYEFRTICGDKHVCSLLEQQYDDM